MSEPVERPDFSVLERPAPDFTSEVRPGVLPKAGRTVERAADWLADRVEDGGAWLATFVRYLPARVLRVLVTLGAAILGTVKLPRGAVRAARPPHHEVRGAQPQQGEVRVYLRACARRGAFRTVQFFLEALDLIGMPEIFAFIWRMVTRVTPLTGQEIAAASLVLGPRALRYQDVRVAEGGVLRWIFKRNGNRAFATFHTVNLPEEGHHQRSNLDIVVHEVVHVYQYEQAGSRYLAEALLGQQQEGYGYGGPDGLAEAAVKGKRFADFNREQQAQIAQDYLAALRLRAPVAPYEPFIDQLRRRRI